MALSPTVLECCVHQKSRIERDNVHTLMNGCLGPVPRNAVTWKLVSPIPSQVHGATVPNMIQLQRLLLSLFVDFCLRLYFEASLNPWEAGALVLFSASFQALCIPAGL